MSTERIEELTRELLSLKVRETAVIEQIRSENRSIQRRSGSRTKTNTKDTHNEFSVGSRVYIKNAIKKPANWNDDSTWDASKERKATITKVTQVNRLLRTEGKAHIITDNGTKTWRALKNIRPLLEEELSTYTPL
jgi:hypothetical protein